jgi:hypothetical protein
MNIILEWFILLKSNNKSYFLVANLFVIIK